MMNRIQSVFNHGIKRLLYNEKVQNNDLSQLKWYDSVYFRGKFYFFYFL